MGFQERISNNFILLRQRFVQESFIDGEGNPVPVNWVHLNGNLAAFFPNERTDFTQRAEGSNTRSLANAYLLGFVQPGDRLSVRYQIPFETWEMVYTGFSGYRKRVLRFGDGALHHLNPVELNPGAIMDSRDITYWRKIKLDQATMEELDQALERVKNERGF